MRKDRQNNFDLTDEYFTKLDEWTRSEETKEATKKKIHLSPKKQRFTYRPYIISFTSGVLITIIFLSFLPTIMIDNHLGINSNNDIDQNKEKAIEYYNYSYDERAWIASVDITPIEVKYEGRKQKVYGNVIIYYKEIGVDMLNMAFYLDGATYTIRYNLRYGNEENALKFAEEFIDERKLEKARNGS